MISKRLRDARLLAGLSQEQLAEKVGLEAVNPRGRISSYETGRAHPPYELVVRFAKIFDYPPCYFYCANDIFAQAVLQLHRDFSNASSAPQIAKREDVCLLAERIQKLVMEMNKLLENQG